MWRVFIKAIKKQETLGWTRECKFTSLLTNVTVWGGGGHLTCTWVAALSAFSSLVNCLNCHYRRQYTATYSLAHSMVPWPRKLHLIVSSTYLCVHSRRGFWPENLPRETREGCHLLTINNKEIGDSKRTKGKGFCLGMFRWVGRAGTFCLASAALAGPVQNIFSLAVHYFNLFVPIAQQAGQAVVLGCLSLSMCLWIYLWARVLYSVL
jgi:hypothetical protein